MSCLVRVVKETAGTRTTSGEYTTRPTPPTGLSPSAISTAYGFPADGGAGETIALVDAYNDPTATADLATFSSEYGLPSCTASDGCFVKVDQTGGAVYPATTTLWALEISLDIEWAHGVAPDAHLLLVEASSTGNTDMFSAVRYAAQHAQYVSMSWGGAEFAGETSIDPIFTATPAVSFFAASGDGASTVLYPSASPDVISVGGTTLGMTPSTDAWTSETAWADAGGGCSLYELASAAQSAYPSYDQSGASCSGRRATPDVALDASPTTGVSVYDTAGDGGGWFTVGGTSVATVLMAARSADASAVVNATAVYGSILPFYNVTTGSNGHPCEVGYNLCSGLGSWNTAVGVVNGGTAGSLTFTPAAQTLTAGFASGAFDVRLTRPAPTGGLAVTLSAGTGGFSSTPGGPFSSPSTITVAAGRTATPSLYFETTVAGPSTLTASAAGWTSTAVTDTVNPGPLTRIVVSPPSATVPEGASQTFAASGYDAYGNAQAVSPTWSAPASAGNLAPTTGVSTAFTAGTTPSAFTLTATSGAVTGTAAVSVTGPAAMTVEVSDSSPIKKGRRYTVPLTIAASGATGPLSRANVSLAVRSGTCTGTQVAAYSGTTGADGTAAFTFATSRTGSYCASALVTEAGYRTGSATLDLTIVPGNRKGKKASLDRLATRLHGVVRA